MSETQRKYKSTKYPEVRLVRDACREASAVSEKLSEKTSEKILSLVGQQPTITIAQLARHKSVSIGEKKQNSFRYTEKVFTNAIAFSI